MRKIKRLRIILLMLVFILAVAPLANAKEFTSRPINNVMKPWEINFNKPVDSSSMTKENFIIYDGKTEIETSLQLINKGQTVKITPIRPYERGKTYRLEVKDLVLSVDGKRLNSAANLIFNVIDQSSAIQSIQHTNGGINTVIKVQTSSEVHKVTVNGNELAMMGVNLYSQALVGLKPGIAITVRAYNGTNRLIETKKYEIGE